MTFHDKDMTPEEIHGTQLRMAADCLEIAADEYAFTAIASVLEAEKLLAAVVAAQQRITDLDS